MSRRITPAYAGKSLCGGQCGGFPIGSPPPMRGKDPHGAGRPEHFRITPAYAGKSMPQKLQIAAPWDHPRLCGEKK